MVCDFPRDVLRASFRMVVFVCGCCFLNPRWSKRAEIAREIPFPRNFNYASSEMSLSLTIGGEVVTLCGNEALFAQLRACDHIMLHDVDLSQFDFKVFLNTIYNRIHMHIDPSSINQAIYRDGNGKHRTHRPCIRYCRVKHSYLSVHRTSMSQRYSMYNAMTINST